jgi:hypothetical protein
MMLFSFNFIVHANGSILQMDGLFDPKELTVGMAGACSSEVLMFLIFNLDRQVSCAG